MGAQKGLIFGSAPCESWTFLQRLRQWPDVVIAADGGLQRARDAGFAPQVYVGDSDSGGAAEPGLPCVPLKPEKDVTDLEAAYNWARDHGLRQLIFTGCTGGRLDHHMAAMALLETAAREGVRGVILDARNRVEFLTPGRHVLPGRGYRYFSLIPVDPMLLGVTITGARYPLKNRDVRRGDSLTVSNECLGEGVEVSFTAGCCYFIQST